MVHVFYFLKNCKEASILPDCHAIQNSLAFAKVLIDILKLLKQRKINISN